MNTFATWHEAREHAQAKANKLGLSCGIEAPTPFRKEWLVILLPAEKHRCGHELRCEVVDPTTTKGS